MKTTFKIKMSNIWLYIILIPFIYPKGFSEYFLGYKRVFTNWLYISIILIIVYFLFEFCIGKIKVKKCFGYLFGYFILMILETLINMGEISEGLQKIFATPALCMICIILFQQDRFQLVNVLGNILLVINALNCTLFCPYIFRKMVNDVGNDLIIFSGHVQTAAQIGTLSVFIAILLYREQRRYKAYALMLFGIATMLISKTQASYGCLLILVMSFLFRKIFIKYISKIKTNYIFNSMIMVNIITIVIVLTEKISFGARYYIWIEIVNKLKNHWLLGYGVYGILINPFWVQWTNGGVGMNYAHNELLQHLIDGGIVLTIAFILMVNRLVRNINNISDSKIIYWSNICLLMYMVDAVCDVVSEYNFVYIFWILLAFIPEILNSREEIKV